MPRYTVNHVLQGPGPVGGNLDKGLTFDRKTFRPGDIVSDADLIDAGFDGKDGRRDIDSLITPKPGGFSPAITVVPGTEDLTPDMEASIRARMAPARKKAEVAAEAE